MRVIIEDLAREQLLINSKQDFIRILKLHNYFNNYFKF